MGIKSALGWLALLLFTTTAQAEGSRDLLKGQGTRLGQSPKSVAAPVTPKTKAPGPLVAAAQSSPRSSLVVVESTLKPRADYEAEIYAGVPLDSPMAREQGFDGGLVYMAFEHHRRGTYRIGRDRIRRLVRLASEERPALTTTQATAGHPLTVRPRDHVDVLDTEDGVVVVDTSTQRAGIFTTSDVYVFPRNATLDQRVGAVENVRSPIRERLREALVAAEWATHPK